MIGKRFGPDTSYQQSKDIKPSEGRKPASENNLEKRVLDYFKQQGKLERYKSQGILKEKVALGVAMSKGNKKEANRIRALIATKNKSSSKKSKSDMSPLDIPKYVRRPGTLTKNVNDPHLSVPTNTELHKDIEDIARSTGLNLVITSGHRGKDHPDHSPGSAHSEVGGAYDISLMEKGRQRSLTDKEKEYVAKALRERGRRVLQEYGSIYKKGKGKAPHLHASTRGHKRSGFLSPSENKVYPTELSEVKLEEDLTKKYLQRPTNSDMEEAFKKRQIEEDNKRRRKFTLNLANQGLTPTVEK